jgi:hypothetical protein
MNLAVKKRKRKYVRLKQVSHLVLRIKQNLKAELLGIKGKILDHKVKHNEIILNLPILEKLVLKNTENTIQRQLQIDL